MLVVAQQTCFSGCVCVCLVPVCGLRVVGFCAIVDTFVVSVCVCLCAESGGVQRRVVS